MTPSEPHRIGIFGGSFNPIHNGHIALARQLLRLVGLSEIWFLVSPLNPFKQGETDLLDDRQRLLLAQTALRNEDSLRASDYEFRLPRPSYTWNTLDHLRADFPDAEFTLIIGADNWLAFDRWARGEYIVSHYDVAIYARQDCPVDAASLPPRAKLYDAGLYPVSSTEIRRRVKSGLSIRGMVPDAILTLVEQCYR